MLSLDGRPLSTLSRRDLARRIAVVPQDTHVTFDFTALEIVLMGRYAHLGAFALEGPADISIARTALAATGTAELEARQFATLSGGEKQRVVIASALAQLSDILLLDGRRRSTSASSTRSPRPRAPQSRAPDDDGDLDARSARATLCTELRAMKSGRVLAQGRRATSDGGQHPPPMASTRTSPSSAPALTVVPLARAD